MKVQPNFNFWQNEPKFPTVQEFPAAAMLPCFTRFSSTYPTFYPRGAVCSPFSTNSSVGPVNHFRRRDGPSRSALRIWGSRPTQMHAAKDPVAFFPKIRSIAALAAGAAKEMRAATGGAPARPISSRSLPTGLEYRRIIAAKCLGADPGASQSASSAIPSVRNTDNGSLTHRIPCYFFEAADLGELTAPISDD
jgi:hypothetical protein